MNRYGQAPISRIPSGDLSSSGMSFMQEGPSAKGGALGSDPRTYTPMSGGKFSLYRHDWGLGRTGQKLNKAWERTFDHALDKGEKRAHKEIDKAIGSGMCKGCCGGRLPRGIKGVSGPHKMVVQARPGTFEYTRGKGLFA